MKALCYLVLIVAFLMYYQQNPVATVVIIFIALCAFLFFRSKRNNNGNIRRGFLKGAHSIQDNHMNDLITLIMLQQLLNPSSSNQNNKNYVLEEKRSDKEIEIEKVKRDILELLEEY